MEEKKLLDLELENHPLSEHTLEHTWIVHTFLKILNNFQKVMEFFDGILFSIKELKTSCQFISKSVDEIEKKSNKNRELWNTFADEWENWKKNQKEKYFFQRSALLSLGENLIEEITEIQPGNYLVIKKIKVIEQNEFALVEDFIMEMVSVGEEGYQLQVELKSKINGEIPTAKVRIDLLLLP